MTEIRSETGFLWRLVWQAIKTPVILVLVLFRRRTLGDLFKPFANILKYVFEPKFTVTMILANIAIFYYVALTNFDITPLMNFPQDILSGRYASLLTSGFLHADPAHLWLNMLGIFVFGRIVERRFGSVKAGIIYFFALIASGALSSLFHIFIAGNNVPGIGASGALMGLVAAAILLDPFYLVYEFFMPMPVIILGWLTIYADVQGILQGAKDGIGHVAHLTGFLAIALGLFVFTKENRSRFLKGLAINIISIVIGLGFYFYFF